jgi:hypothetical protein
MKKLSINRTLSLAALIGAAAIPGFAKPAPTTTTVSFNPNPIVAGTDATITAKTVLTAGGDFIPEVGTLRLARLVLAGVQVPCGTAGASNQWIIAERKTDGSISVTEGSTLLPGSYGYVAQFLPNAGDAGTIHESGPVCANLDVTAFETPCNGVILSVANAGSGAIDALQPVDNPWTGGFTISLRNCTADPIVGVKVQGGGSAWTTIDSYLQTSGAVAAPAKKGAQVLTWTVSVAPGATERLTVNESGTIKKNTPVGTEFFLNGPWSAVVNGVKTDYTGRISIIAVLP